MRVRKKPVEVEAIELQHPDNDNTTATPQWLVQAILDGVVNPLVDGTINVHTNRGVTIANPGDYLIRGVEGELYPCPASVFHATYDIIEE